MVGDTGRAETRRVGSGRPRGGRLGVDEGVEKHRSRYENEDERRGRKVLPSVVLQELRNIPYARSETENDGLVCACTVRQKSCETVPYG